MNRNKKNILLFLLIVVLSYLVSGWTGQLYELIIGRQIPGGWIGGCVECFEGFAIAFAFFSGLILFGFSDSGRYKLTLPFLLFFPTILILARIGEAFLISLAAGVIGLGLGQVVYLVRKKLNRS